MSTQHEALLLAAALEAGIVQGHIIIHTGRKAASELRRLHALNQELLGALRDLLNYENIGAYERADVRKRAIAMTKSMFKE